MRDNAKTLRLLRFSMHFLCILPLPVLLVAYLTGNLTVNPIQAATQRTGDIAIFLLLLSFACTPLHNLTGYSPLLRLQRPLGLYTFLYAFFHLILFIGVDYGFNFRYLFPEFLEKRYLWVSLPAFLILFVLAITSFKYAKRLLGRNWKRLHRMVYLAIILVILHLAWVVKGDLFQLSGDIWKPLIAGIVAFLLLSMRLPLLARLLRNRLKP
jgi:sulfoxide reductase heme-binding subunit YedZ